MISNRKEVEKCISKQIQNLTKIKSKNFDVVKKFDVDMFHTRLRTGKAFAAEQKIIELKKILLRSKRFKKKELDQMS